MEIEDEVVFLEPAVNKDVSDHQPTPGIVPDGKSDSVFKENR